MLDLRGSDRIVPPDLPIRPWHATSIRFRTVCVRLTLPSRRCLALPVSASISLRDGLSATRDGDAEVVVEGQGLRLTFRPGHPAIAGALMGLAPPGCDEEKVADALLEAGGPSILATWYHAIDRLKRRGWLSRSLRTAGGPLVTVLPVSTSLLWGGRSEPMSPDRRYYLSRFAYLRREGNAMILEAPTAPACVVVHDPAVGALIAALAVPSTVSALVACAASLPVEAISAVVGILIEAGMVEPAPESEGGPIAASLDAWEFHDLLFHARTRRGRTDAPLGGTYRLAGRMEAPPAVRTIPEGERRPLYRPDLARMQEEDPPLSRLVESRRSERVYGHPPIGARQLGEFLYRVARIRGERTPEGEAPGGEFRIATASRPYPSGGALYELEFYTAIAACEGLEAGLHYYEPRGHALIRISGLTDPVEGLLRDAAESAGIPRESLQVLVILAARLPRIAWKYASIAYSLVLKHVGVVDHAMYLAATAMGLAPCALGTGDSDLFARATGTDYYVETSVGEFLIGSRPR